MCTFNFKLMFITSDSQIILFYENFTSIENNLHKNDGFSTVKTLRHPNHHIM